MHTWSEDWKRVVITTITIMFMVQIEEEISIPRDRLELVRSGRPQLVGDGNRRFAVHPFLFRLLGEDVPPLTLNWESVDARWVSAEEMQVRRTATLVLPNVWNWRRGGRGGFLRDRGKGSKNGLSWSSGRWCL